MRYWPAAAAVWGLVGWVGSPVAADIVITEIHYSPLDGSGAPRPDLEFVEIFNDGSEPYDLSGYHFTKGLSYVLPAGTYLGAQSYLVVCRNVSAMTGYYGIANAAGSFSQALDDAGETIALANPQGAVVSSVSYNDRGRWPAGAKGTGHSLSIRTPYADPADPDSWTISAARGGTPGSQNFADPAALAATVVINEGYTRSGVGDERFVELFNTTSQTVDLSGYHLSDDFSHLTKFVIPGGTEIAPYGFLAYTESETALDLAFAPVTRERIEVALARPDGVTVVDALILAPAVGGRSEARVPDGDRELQPAALPTPGAANASPAATGVVINEILYNPITGSDLDEFLELYNRGPGSIDLSGWRLDGVALTLPPGTSIGAGEHLVLARDPERLRSVYGLPAAAVHATAWTGSLRDGGERLKLLDAQGNLADEVSYKDGGDWPVWADGGGSSLELVDAESDNSVSSSWDASDDAAKAVAATVTYGPVPFGSAESDFGMMLAERGIAFIDDIALVRVNDPTETNLINNGSFETGSTPWRIEGTHIRSGQTSRAGEVLAGAGSLKLICWNGSGDYKVNRIEQDTASQTGGTFNVTFTGRWVVGSPRVITIGDYSFSAPGNPGLAGSNALPVPANLGTPGATNSVTARRIAGTGSSNMGPAIDRVRHAPGVPQANETVMVSARIRDPQGIGSVKLFYRTETPVGGFTELDMAPADGLGLHTAVIPGQALGIRVLFYVEATDSSGVVSRYPTDIYQRTHGPLVNPDAPQPADRLYCMYRHDTRNVVTNHHSYRFILSEASENYLITRKIHSNEMVEGTFVFGSGDVYYNAQIRFAGSPFLRRSGTWNNSFSIRMPRDKPLHDRKRAFNLDQHGADGRERISHYLLRHSAGSGVQLPYYDFHTLAQFQLNDVRNSVFEALDKPNGQYVSFWFPDADDGPFFEMDDRFGFNDGGTQTRNADGRVQYPPYGTTGGENKELYRWYFSPRSHESADDFTAFQSFCRTLDEGVTPNAAFDVNVWDQVDVEEMLRVWAIRMNTDDWDTWGGRRGKNCYFYQSPADGLWRLIPWDLELTYGNVNAMPLPANPATIYSNNFPEIQRLINRPRIKRMYYGILADQVSTTTGFFRSAHLSPYLQQLSAAGVTNTNIGTPGGFIDQRAASLRTALRNAIYPQVRLTITTGGGNPFVTSAPAVDLTGGAPADVFFLVAIKDGLAVDPAPATTFSDANMTGWTMASVPLAPGRNVIEILGFGSDDRLIDSDTIEVVQADWDPPVLAESLPGSGRPGDAVVLTGTGIHDRVKVLFGATEAVQVTFDEAADPSHVAAVVPAGLAAGAIEVSLVNLDGQASNPVSFTVLPPQPRFIRGDANLDGSLDISDAVRMLLHMFGGVPASCEDALDADDSGALNATDPIVLLEYSFKGGPQLPPPSTAAGTDPTEDDLGCEQGLP